MQDSHLNAENVRHQYTRVQKSQCLPTLKLDIKKLSLLFFLSACSPMGAPPTLKELCHNILSHFLQRAK